MKNFSQWLNESQNIKLRYYIRHSGGKSLDLQPLPNTFENSEFWLTKLDHIEQAYLIFLDILTYRVILGKKADVTYLSVDPERLWDDANYGVQYIEDMDGNVSVDELFVQIKDEFGEFSDHLLLSFKMLIHPTGTRDDRPEWILEDLSDVEVKAFDEKGDDYEELDLYQLKEPSSTVKMEDLKILVEAAIIQNFAGCEYYSDSVADRFSKVSSLKFPPALTEKIQELMKTRTVRTRVSSRNYGLS